MMKMRKCERTKHEKGTGCKEKSNPFQPQSKRERA